MKSVRDQPAASQRSLAAFSLVELMVAMGILSFIGYVFVQTVSMISMTTQLSSKALDAGDQARFVMDRLNLDFSRMPVRPDIGYHFKNTTLPQDIFRILSQVKAPQGGRGISLVSYQIRKDQGKRLGLYRGVHGYEWEDAGFMGMSSQGTVTSLMNLSGEKTIQSGDYELIAPGVFRMDLAFQRKSDGKLVREFEQLLQTGLSSTSYGITNIGSIVVSLVTVDEVSRQSLTPEQIELLAKSFSNPSNDEMAIQNWMTLVESGGLAKIPGIPKGLVSKVQVSQRFYPIGD